MASFLHANGVRRVIASPGSRSAPLVLAFSRAAAFERYIVPDERSAAYIALGMSVARGEPVVLFCTSGTAVLNYYPAVAEAFYQQVPLFVITADRPPEWVGQQEGQTIHQRDVYGKHVKASYTLPDDLHSAHQWWHAKRMVKEALFLATTGPRGPVHLNVPLRPPLYNIPAAAPAFPFSTCALVGTPALSFVFTSALKEGLFASSRILAVVGQYTPILAAEGRAETPLGSLLSFFAQTAGAVVVGDCTANLSDEAHVISCVDACLLPIEGKTIRDAAAYAPDLLISLGGTVLSKQLKRLLRAHPASMHWRIGMESPAPDTFQSLTHVLHTEPLAFFQAFRDWAAQSADFSPTPAMKKTRARYCALWQSCHRVLQAKRELFFVSCALGFFLRGEGDLGRVASIVCRARCQ